MKHILQTPSVRHFFGVSLIIGGIIHWLIIGGILHEVTPFFLTLVFHSLAVLDIAAGIGILAKKRWAFVLALLIGVTQIPSHTYMMYLDTFYAYDSGVGSVERLVDITYSLFLIYFTLYTLKKKNHN